MLKEGITIKDVDHVAYSFDPWLLLDQNKYDQTICLPLEPSANPKPEEWLNVWDPLFLSSIVNAPRQLRDGYPHHLASVFDVENNPKQQWHFVDHHLSHAASTYLASPYSDAAVMVIDGRGEKITTSYYTGEGNELKRISQVEQPNSLGLFYEEMTDYLGFLRSSDEYKVMALASFGKPVYLDRFLSKIHLGEKGRYTIDPFSFAEEFGAPRKRGEPLTQKHYDIACSGQEVLEQTILKLTEWLQKETGKSTLCFAGGVALNCVLNGVLQRKGTFDKIWVQPASGDSGTSLGAALYIDAKQHPQSKKHFVMESPYYGPSFTDEEIEKVLKWTHTRYQQVDNIAEVAAQLLAGDKVIGWFQGGMEFGPRALGNRSFLASPMSTDMQQKLNEIKARESFRPVAPAVLEEDAAEWFEDIDVSPFMLFVYHIRPEQRDKIPAASHIDGTARVQTVNEVMNPEFYKLLKEFKKKTGVPILVNTSFNTKGEPIVCSPQDALACFWTSPLDALIMNSFLILK